MKSGVLQRIQSSADRSIGRPPCVLPRTSCHQWPSKTPGLIFAHDHTELFDIPAKMFRRNPLDNARKSLDSVHDHPGIVDLRFTCKDDENLYFILEPLLGGPLYKHIRAGPRGFMEVPAARFYASEIVSAIAHMHGLNCMHRDLKANNIVLCADGHVKLVDLGSSKQNKPRVPQAGDSDSNDGFWEKSYTYCGTPHCMAPEMISREGHTPAVDWWSVGILIHEMTARQPPFGYGGCDLHLRIAAGILGDREEGCAPETMEREAAAAIYLPVVRRLLDTNPRNRLGSDGGADAVMSHAWFASIDWTKIRQNEVEPPHFRKNLGVIGALEEGKASATGAKTGDWFAEFLKVSRRWQSRL